MKKLMVMLAVVAISLQSCNSSQAKNNGNESTGGEKPAGAVSASNAADGGTVKLTKAKFLAEVWDYENSPKEWKFKGKKPAVIDFYADWCVTCKEMELLTFSDEKVKAALSAYQLIQVDVTKNTVEHQRILKQYALFGPPAILFFDANGEEKVSKRVIGFMKAERFLERLQ